MGMYHNLEVAFMLSLDLFLYVRHYFSTVAIKLNKMNRFKAVKVLNQKIYLTWQV